MSTVDWFIVLGLIVFIAAMAATTHKYNRSVADFLSANRCAGRYLLGVADGMAALGAITIIANFEKTFAAGFAPVFWMTMVIPISMVITLSGFVTYRYRESRAMTMAQFFEMRYSRKFRIFAGILAWIAGIVNFGIFSGVSARFFISFCRLPNQFEIMGSTWGSFPVVMAIICFIALTFTLVGGQISVLVTDFWQGLFAIIAIIAILAFLWINFSWDSIIEGVITASKPEQSLIDPFDIKKAAEFSIWFYLIIWFNRVYNHQAWQGASAYDCSAINPHEQKMARVVGTLRGTLTQVGFLFIPLVAIAIMSLPEFRDKAATVLSELNTLYLGIEDNAEQVSTQMMVPTVLTVVLPKGLVGLFAAAMLGFFISTQNTYMHSWGSIFIQDVVMPFRGKPFAPKTHLLMLRLSITAVCLFGYLFSLFFEIQEYIVMFFMITGAIYMGGAGSAVIGGMYWRKGTTKGAWAAMGLGSLLSLSCVILRFTWPYSNWLQQFGPKFPIDGAVNSFWIAVICIGTYVIVSLLDRKPELTDFDRLFHRGKYAIRSEHEKENQQPVNISIWWRLIGVNKREFSFIDRLLFVFVFSKSMILLGAFILVCILHWAGMMTLEYWGHFWFSYIILLTFIGVTAGLWVSIGGMFDLRKMYQRLKSTARNDADDGWVEGHVSLADTDQKTIEKVLPKSHESSSERL